MRDITFASLRGGIEVNAKLRRLCKHSQHVCNPDWAFMKNLFFYVFTLLLLLSQGKTTGDITGRWETVEPEKVEQDTEGLHRIFQFNSDGSFTTLVGVSFKGIYKLQDNQLVIDSPRSGSEMEKITQQISIRGNTLIINFEGTEMKGIRLSPRVPDSPALVGRWQFDFPAPHGGKAGVWNSNSVRMEKSYPGSSFIL